MSKLSNMTPAARKQRDIQQRQALILDVAQGMLLEGGYLGLNMDRIAEATGYAKGTIERRAT
jgi:AcrR family transcriptional regulator